MILKCLHNGLSNELCRRITSAQSNCRHGVVRDRLALHVSWPHHPDIGGSNGSTRRNVLGDACGGVETWWLTLNHASDGVVRAEGIGGEGAPQGVRFPLSTPISMAVGDSDEGTPLLSSPTS
jgi:hypothetical protein